MLSAIEFYSSKKKTVNLKTFEKEASGAIYLFICLYMTILEQFTTKLRGKYRDLPYSTIPTRA